MNATLAPPIAPANDDTGIPNEAIAGLLAALGIGAVGYAVMRSRRRRDEEVVEDHGAEAPIATSYASDGEREQVPAAPAFVAPQTATGVRYDFAHAPASAAPDDTMVIDREPVTTQMPREAVAIPAGAAPTTEERASLLERMVAAEPDEANPFTSGPARRKRARILLQHHEQQQRENANAPFDWRTYRPETKPSTPASPSLVTA